MATIANDKLDTYYAEKLWQWIPEVYRTEDGKADKPGVLRAIIEVIAEQAAIARRSIDRLHEDSFIETSDDWAVPYIGDLVGTRLVSALNRAGRRVDVSKTIFYRRRKGTPSVLETLIRDIARIDGALVEAFRRLARMRHGLDNPVTPRLEGRFTRTLPGGWAALRSTRGAEIVDGPFDEFAHTPDVRPLSGTRGRYNIPKLNFHLYRLEAFAIDLGANPGGSGARLTFDPSGRDVPLFMPGERPEPCQLAKPWEVRAPIQCGLLAHAEYELTEDEAVTLAAGLVDPQRSALFTLVGVRFRSEERVLLTLQALDLQIGGNVLAGLFHQFLAAALVLESGRAELIRGEDQDVPKIGAISVKLTSTLFLEPTDAAAGNLLFWNETPAPEPFDPDVTVVIDPERGRMFFPHGAPTAAPTILNYFYGFSGDIGAGPYDRAGFLADGASLLASNGGAVTVPSSGVRQLTDDFTYTTSGDVSVTGDLTLQVASDARPYVVNNAAPSPSAWVWTATGGSRNLVLEGLWLGIDDGATGERTFALDGTWGTVTIRHSTIDPGGERLLERDRGVTLTNPPVAVPSVALEIRGTIQNLVIDSSIVGRIRLGASGGAVEKLTLTDSIVQAQPGAGPAIDLPSTSADMARVTVFGDVVLDRLDATEVIIAGTATVTDNQHGCFRFSAAFPGSELPRQFHSPPLEEIPSRVFVSQRFGSPGFAQLRSTAPVDLLRGAENGSEKGAFSGLDMPIRLDSLAIKVDEFKPVGLLPQFILET